MISFGITDVSTVPRASTLPLTYTTDTWCWWWWRWGCTLDKALSFTPKVSAESSDS